jgi:hypothetical protein
VTPLIARYGRDEPQEGSVALRNKKASYPINRFQQVIIPCGKYGLENGLLVSKCSCHITSVRVVCYQCQESAHCCFRHVYRDRSQPS